VWAFRLFPRRHPVRAQALATFVLVMVEAGIGAGLVLRQLVASNASGARAVAVALHLTNTLLLTAAAALTVALARRGSSDEARAATFARSAAQAPSAAGAAAGFRPAGAGGWLRLLLGLLVLVAASGAVTALGDTLFPVNGTAVPADHFLVQLRVLHPLLACFVVCACILVGLRFAREPGCRPWALGLVTLSSVQLVFGALNIALHAPGWLQLGHLLGAQLTWICAVLLTEAWYRPRLGQVARSELAPIALP
jgi:heme A synthase